MKTALYASIGWNQADCAVCATPTRMRIQVGDGCAPICSPTCEAAWPNVKRLLENAGRAETRAYAAETSNGKAKELLARTHALLEMQDSPPRTLLAEIATHMGWERSPHDPNTKETGR